MPNSRDTVMNECRDVDCRLDVAKGIMGVVMSKAVRRGKPI